MNAQASRTLLIFVASSALGGKSNFDAFRKANSRSTVPGPTGCLRENIGGKANQLNADK
jgi:hypothetical protein